jgi:hypothetical protein
LGFDILATLPKIGQIFPNLLVTLPTTNEELIIGKMVCNLFVFKGSGSLNIAQQTNEN